jgi:hypothetical protein
MDWKEFQLDKELDHASNIPSLYRVDYARCGISNGSNETFVAVMDQSSKLDDGSIIRCENKANVLVCRQIGDGINVRK